MEAKERVTPKKNLTAHDTFLTDMRFWLIVLMLAAFVLFLIYVSPA
jgi:hypothetical protein